MDEHEEWVRIGAAFGVVAGAVGLGVGLSRTFRMDAQKQVDRYKAKNEELNNEIVEIYRWLDAQIEAGAELKKLDGDIVLDPQEHGRYIF